MCYSINLTFSSRTSYKLFNLPFLGKSALFPFCFFCTLRFKERNGRKNELLVLALGLYSALKRTEEAEETEYYEPQLSFLLALYGRAFAAFSVDFSKFFLTFISLRLLPWVTSPFSQSRARLRRLYYTAIRTYIHSYMFR